MSLPEPVVEIRDLRTYFPVPQNVVSRLRNGPTMVRAVDGVSLTVNRGETVGLVGESGLWQEHAGPLDPAPGATHSGDIRIDGTDVVRASGPEFRQVRRRAQIIFQDPLVAEPAHDRWPDPERTARDL